MVMAIIITDFINHLYFNYHQHIQNIFNFFQRSTFRILQILNYLKNLQA